MLMVKPNQLTVDGCADVLLDDAFYCCPPPLCGNDLCCTFVAFFNLLPSGPLWDYWKQAAISYFQYNADKPEECPLLQNPECPSIILHAIYTVLKLKKLVHDALWPAFRESNPYTAVTTLDDHLARLQWEDCYAQHCRSVLLGDITAYEIFGECGPEYCDITLPPDLAAAVNRGIAIALTRAQMGVIKNLCGLNWIIEPLGAVMLPMYAGAPAPDIAEAARDCSSLCLDEPPHFVICRSRNWLHGPGSGDVCDTLGPLPKIPAFWSHGCDKPAGLPAIIWPAVMAAECIVRSMLRSTVPSMVTSLHPDCCDLVDEPPFCVEPPLIRGVVADGSTLTCWPGMWIGSTPMIHSYQWQENGVNIPDATSYIFVLGDIEIGVAYTCVVTTTNDHGTRVRTSNILVASEVNNMMTEDADVMLTEDGVDMLTEDA